jgi:hypothetical protein
MPSDDVVMGHAERTVLRFDKIFRNKEFAR